MRILSIRTYHEVENLLRDSYKESDADKNYIEAIAEIKNFFNKTPYKDFLNIFYLERHLYKNRYPSDRVLFTHLCRQLYLQEPTLYVIKKEIIYKSAMIFYKRNLIKGD